MANDGSAMPPDSVMQADRLCEDLLARPTVERAAAAALLLGPLRDLREFERLCALGDLVCRLRWDDAKAHRLYAQGLIETGRLAAAVGLLEAVKSRYGEESSERSEFEGLLGRAYKQLFFDTVDPQGVWASTFVERAIASYSGPYARDRAKNFWHGINLGALTHAAKIRGLALAGAAEEYAADVLANLYEIHAKDRDQWWYATKAEAHAALLEWEASEEALRTYIDDPRTEPFMLASTLRQLRDLWAIQREPRGARLLQMLEATLMSRPKPGAVLRMGVPHLLEMRALKPKNDETGLKRAASVAAVKERLGLRFGTGFAVRAADFGVAPSDEVLLLTNFHVLNKAGLDGQTDFSNVEVVFEAIAEKPLKCSVRYVVAESKEDGGLDYALLRLSGATKRVQPVPLKRSISAADSRARIYVIGYPLGDVLQYSLHDNELLDHECEPPESRPFRPGAACNTPRARNRETRAAPCSTTNGTASLFIMRAERATGERNDTGFPG
jgi:hypothetical protein